MIAVHTTGTFLKGLIEYNENKVYKKKASLLFSNNLEETSDGFIKQYFHITKSLEQKTNAIGPTVLHVSLNFHKNDSEKLSDPFLRQISIEFLESIGIPFDHPYLIYKHFDKEHPHVHIIMPNYTEEGKQINSSYSLKKYIKICKEKEQKYGLVVASEQKKLKGETSVESAPQERKTALQIIENELRSILKKRPEKLETIHRTLQHVSSTYAGTECNINYTLSAKGTGITFYLADKRTGRQLSKGIKGSKIPPNCGLNKINEQLTKNQSLKENLRFGIGKIMLEALTSCTSLKEFKVALEAKNITLKTFTNPATGRIFGLAIIEGRSGAEFKASEIHRSLSWSVIEKTLQRNAAEKKQALSEPEKTKLTTPPTIKPTAMKLKLIKELKEEISIKDIAEHLGYRITEGIRLHSQWITMKSEKRSTIIIANNKGLFNYYQDSGDNLKKGSVVDFIIDQGIVTNESEAMLWLNNYLEIHPSVRATLPSPTPSYTPSEERLPFTPYPFTHPAGVDDYLAHHGITKGAGEKLYPQLAGSLTVEELTSDAFKKVAPFYKNTSPYHPSIFNLLNVNNPSKIVGQEIKGVGITGHILAGSDKTVGAWFIPTPAAHKNATIVVTESPAKTMAYMELYPNDNHYPFATMGNSSRAVIAYLTAIHKSGTPLVLGGDNDIAGQYFNAKILCAIASDKLGVTISPSFPPTKTSFTLTASGEKELSAEVLKLFETISKKLNIKQEHTSPFLTSITVPVNYENINRIQEMLAIVKENLQLQATLVAPTDGKDFNDELLVKQKKQKINSTQQKI